MNVKKIADQTLYTYLGGEIPGLLEDTRPLESLVVPGAIVEDSEFFRIIVPPWLTFTRLIACVVHYYIECGYTLHKATELTSTSYRIIATREKEQVAISLQVSEGVSDCMGVAIIAAAMP